jgi:2,4-dienoyl-CoA reductase-like NADH-dependent reductase (Old Yellow Enzyme family)
MRSRHCAEAWSPTSLLDHRAYGSENFRPIPQKDLPYAERVRKEVGIATMAVGIILEAQQAEAILENGQADLIAVGRQSQFNPNTAQHWAHDLGINGKFEDWTPEYGWWLEKRTRTIKRFATPTGIVKRNA